MKRASRSTTRRPDRPGAGAGARARKPTPGWKSRTDAVQGGWQNPRAPAVPAGLDLRLDEYFSATALMGLLASQADEPDQRWCCDWSFRMGRTMAAEARRRRQRKRPA